LHVLQVPGKNSAYELNCMCCRCQGQNPRRTANMVVMLRQCCCGCSLKTGSTIISVTDTVSIQL